MEKGGSVILKGKRIARREPVGNCLADHFREDDWRWLFTAMVSQEQTQKLELLSSILYQSDSDELPSLEEKIYTFGSLLTEKDYLERELFVYMVTMLNSAKFTYLMKQDELQELK